jgi:hypothetical protein
MLISIDLQMKLMKGFETFMQVSILVPMVISWQRRQHLPAPVKLASKYVYLSALSVIVGKLAAHYFHNNHLVIVGFNVGKLLLFSAVYAQVLMPSLWYSFLRRLTVIALCVVAGLVFYDWRMAFTVARMAQATLLAGYALAYLDQSLNADARRFANTDPMWLLSVGTLFCAACAVTSYSIDLFELDEFSGSTAFLFIAFSSLIFNFFLTLSLLRAQLQAVALPATADYSASPLAQR